jgi:aminopeptidase
MVDPRIEKLAKLCVHYSVRVKSRDKVSMEGDPAALPLLREIYKECLLSGAYPQITLSDSVFEYVFYECAKEHQLRFVSPFRRFLLENVDVNIRVSCNPKPRELANVDPARIAMHQTSYRELRGIQDRRFTEGKLRWTVLPYPISAQAQDASMSLEEYEDFVYGSCLVDKKDPVAEWRKIGRQQERICRFLNEADEISIVGEDTELTLSVKNRKWFDADGKQNMPDGEVGTSPVETSINGRIRFTYPGIYLGREVEDISLTLERGKVVKASATKGDELLKEILKIEGANRIGEVSIGTNYGIKKFTKHMLFDEKIGGTLHMALGNSYAVTGGLNKSAIHWDILKDMKKHGEIYADEKLFYKNGKFLI